MAVGRKAKKTGGVKNRSPAVGSVDISADESQIVRDVYIDAWVKTVQRRKFARDGEAENDSGSSQRAGESRAVKKPRPVR